MTFKVWLTVAIAAWPSVIFAVADHDSGCEVSSADPATYNVIHVPPRMFYQEERGNPTGITPPPPGSGSSPGGEGTWNYEEANGVAGLQRGGIGANGVEDPMNDETCGHGPDAIISSAYPGQNPNPIYPFSAEIVQAVAGGVPSVVTSEPARCGVTTSARSASIVCMPPAGDWACGVPFVKATAHVGWVTGRTQCANGPLVDVTAFAPGTQFDNDPSIVNHPWSCQASFSLDGVGSVYCYEPDP